MIMQCCHVKNKQDFKIIKITWCHIYNLNYHTSLIGRSGNTTDLSDDFSDNTIPRPVLLTISKLAIPDRNQSISEPHNLCQLIHKIHNVSFIHSIHIHNIMWGGTVHIFQHCIGLNLEKETTSVSKYKLLTEISQ